MSCMRVILRSVSRSSSGAQTMVLWIICSATRRAATAVLRQAFSTRRDSTIPSRLLGVTVRRPAKAACAAFSLLQAFGKAGESCGQYLQAYEEERKLRPAGAPEGLAFSDRYAAFLDFADGYMTGANSYTQGADRLLGQGTDHLGRMAWLKNYCQAHPIDVFLTALLHLRKYLAQSR